MIGNSGSVCVDMVTVEDGEKEGEFVWMDAVVIVGVEASRHSVWIEMEEVVNGIVWVATLGWDARANSQRSHSFCIPALWDSWQRSLMLVKVERCCMSYLAVRLSCNEASWASHPSIPYSKPWSYASSCINLSFSANAVAASCMSCS